MQLNFIMNELHSIRECYLYWKQTNKQNNQIYFMFSIECIINGKIYKQCNINKLKWLNSALERYYNLLVN